ncbi:MAG: addiction module protein [Gammaproteobacteria bacterium]|nr:addiction module protein [Gammaproteobacteria bacterium]
MNTIVEDIKKLSVSERIQLVEYIWNSITDESPSSLKLSASERDELHRRYSAHQADPSTSIPWAQVRAKLFKD